jgi:hypothetical protein
MLKTMYKLGGGGGGSSKQDIYKIRKSYFKEKMSNSLLEWRTAQMETMWKKQFTGSLEAVDMSC